MIIFAALDEGDKGDLKNFQQSVDFWIRDVTANHYNLNVGA